MLLRVMFMLLSLFAVLSASVASPHTVHASNHTLEQQASVAHDRAEEPQILFLGDEALALAECNCDGFDESTAPEQVHRRSAETTGKSAPPTYPLFDFLRARTSAPRAPPALA